MPDNAKTIRIEVMRFRPEQESEPVWESFTIPYTDDMSVLQGLQHIKDEVDGSLSFRWSCRMACFSAAAPRAAMTKASDPTAPGATAASQPGRCPAPSAPCATSMR